eukprot:GEZU01015883.1.p1 GENE.GEZU01015883.1~~GEZU01015883.1.p1  ORF type:complete len:176 (-),score=60.45 GEZU01015883.1:529-1056(-)
MPKLSQSIEINALVQDCIKVVTDYNKYTEFVPSIIKSEISKEYENGDVLVDYTLTTAIKNVSYSLRSGRAKDDKGNEVITWKSENQWLFNKNEGGWTLEEITDEHGNKKTKATYTIDIEISTWVPGWLESWLIGSSLPATLAAFKNRIEKLAATAAATPNTNNTTTDSDAPQPAV